MIYFKQNFNEIRQAIKDHRSNQYWFCHFLLGYPKCGVTYTLSNNPLFNDGKLLSQFTFGKWLD